MFDRLTSETVNAGFVRDYFADSTLMEWWLWDAAAERHSMLWFWLFGDEGRELRSESLFFRDLTNCLVRKLIWTYVDIYFHLVHSGSHRRCSADGHKMECSTSGL